MSPSHITQRMNKALMILSSVVVLALSAGCDQGDIYPSYAGTYELKEKRLEGYWTENGEALPDFPLKHELPEMIEVYQRLFTQTGYERALSFGLFRISPARRDCSSRRTSAATARSAINS